MEKLRRRRRRRRRVAGVLLVMALISVLPDLGSCNDAGRGV
jgi:hypothetical protein